jgi:hypothetical protein
MEIVKGLAQRVADGFNVHRCVKSFGMRMVAMAFSTPKSATTQGQHCPLVQCSPRSIGGPLVDAKRIHADSPRPLPLLCSQTLNRFHCFAGWQQNASHRFFVGDTPRRSIAIDDICFNYHGGHCDVFETHRFFH